MRKYPSPPSILSGRNGHILLIPSIPNHCLPSNQKNHTFYLDLADFLKYTLKEALYKFHLSFAKDIWQSYSFVFSGSKQTESSLAQRNFKLLMCFCENME